MNFIRKHKLALCWAFIALCVAIAGKHVADCRGEGAGCLGNTVIVEGQVR